jgi:hypothetical protein
MNRASGMMLFVTGICVVIVGLMMMSGALSWFGRLPGDFRFGGERFRVYVPLASMLLVSLVLSLIFYLLRRFF